MNCQSTISASTGHAICATVLLDDARSIVEVIAVQFGGIERGFTLSNLISVENDRDAMAVQQFHDDRDTPNNTAQQSGASHPFSENVHSDYLDYIRPVGSRRVHHIVCRWRGITGDGGVQIVKTTLNKSKQDG